MDSDGHLASPPVRVPLPQEQDAAAALGTRKLLGHMTDKSLKIA